MLIYRFFSDDYGFWFNLSENQLFPRAKQKTVGEETFIFCNLMLICNDFGKPHKLRDIRRKNNLFSSIWLFLRMLRCFNVDEKQK